MQKDTGGLAGGIFSHTSKHHYLEARFTDKSILATRKKVQILAYYKFPKMVH